MGWGYSSVGGTAVGGVGTCTGGFFGSRQAWVIFLILILLLMGTWGGFCTGL